MKKRGRPASPDTPYTMWLCYYLSCEFSENADLLPQHSQSEGSIGGYTLVGEKLHLSAKRVEQHANNARRRRDIDHGLEYIEWREHRETHWWFYHAVCVEKRELKLLEYVGEIEGDTLILSRGDLHFTPKEVEAIVAKAQKRLTESRGKHDYDDWLALYEQRDESGRSKPQKFRIFPADHPESITFRERRTAKGLRNELKHKRPRRTN